MTLPDWLTHARERADKATSGPWDTYYATGETPSIIRYSKKEGSEFNTYEESVLPLWPKKEQDWVNAEFIAAARTDVPKLLAMLRLAIEQRDTAYTCSWDKDLVGMIADDDLALLAVGRGE